MIEKSFHLTGTAAVLAGCCIFFDYIDFQDCFSLCSLVHLQISDLDFEEIGSQDLKTTRLAVAFMDEHIDTCAELNDRSFQQQSDTAVEEAI